MTLPKYQAQELARKLFLEGCTPCEIARHPAIKAINDGNPVAKSSVYSWTKPVKPLLSEEAIRLQTKKRDKARAENAKKARKATKTRAAAKRLEYQNEGRLLYRENDSFRILCFMYWGEGDKKKTRCSITNTDPAILKLLADWLDTFDQPYKFLAHYYPENGYTEEEIYQWWLKKLPNIARAKRSPFYSKVSNRSKDITKYPYGLGVITAFSVYCRQLIEGGIQELKKDILDSNIFITKLTLLQDEA